MSIKYKCPVCDSSLELLGKSYVCQNRHTFDVSKEGYVNFAIGKSDSGDSADMCLSRRNFLSKGYYKNFSDLLNCCIEKYASVSGLVDAGCGEGYYLRKLRERLPSAELFGVDLAKEAVRLAAKAEKQSEYKKNKYCVGGIFSLPFSDGTFDAVLSVFAPVAQAENHRVLKRGGHMFVAGPGKMHLSGLKSAIYDAPYENAEKHSEYEGFVYLGNESCEYDVTVEGCDIFDLFTMTPYYWKTSKKDSDKLLKLEKLDTVLSFQVSVYEKI